MVDESKFSVDELWDSDYFDGKTPENLTPRDIDLLLARNKLYQKHFSEASARNYDLEKEIESLKKKKMLELAKPIKPREGRVYFIDLMKWLLKIYHDERQAYSHEDMFKPDFNSNAPAVVKKREQDLEVLAEHTAELILLLTTFLDYYGFGAGKRKKIFEKLNDGKWFNEY